LFGELTSDRSQRLGRVGRSLNICNPVRVERRRRGNDDARPDQVAQHRTGVRIHPFRVVVAQCHTFFDHRALLEELLVGRNRRADQGYDQQQIPRIAVQARHQRAMGHCAPVRLGQHDRRRIRQKGEGHHQKQTFGDAVAAEQYRQPHQHCAGGYGDVPGHAQELSGRGDARELRGDDPTIANQDCADRYQGPADAEPFANQVEQSAPCRRAHPRGHLLDDGQRHGQDDQQPQQVIAQARADDADGANTARVVSGDRRNHPRPKDRQPA
jgi:hypothetical protein